MKTLYIYLGIFIIFLQGSVLFAQCDPPLITTNPDAPVNNENQAKKNTFFDWRDEHYDLNFSPDGVLIETNIPSPFNQTNNSEVDHLYLSDDFEPQDGWELIHRDLGYEDDGTKKTDLVNPYVILYNKYTGILRVFIAIGARENDYDACEIRLAFNSNTSVKTALFGPLESITEPIKTFSSDIQISSISRFLNEDKKWMAADFQMGYDPCTCNNSSRLQINGLLTDSAKVTLSGSSLGTISAAKITNKTGAVNQFKFKTAFSKAGKALKSGIKTYKSIQGFESKFDTISTIIGNIPLGIAPAPNIKKGLQNLALNMAKNDFLKEGLRSLPYIGLAISAFSSFTAGGKKSSPQQVAFGPLALETKMEFDGFISSEKLYKEVIINNPGSPQTSAAGNRYPYYNEVMGLMNVLERPKIQPKQYHNFDVNWNNQTGNYVAEFSSIIQFELSQDILYAINPATEFKQTDVDILGAIFLRLPVNDPHNQDGLIKVKNGLYRTPYLPLSCLEGYAAEIELYPPRSHWPSTPNSFTWYFQMMANLERTDVPDAQNVLFASSYKVDLLPTQSHSYNTLRSPTSYPNLLGENVNLQNQSLTGGTVLYATQSITIGPNVSITGNGDVTLIAGNEIIVEPGVELPLGLDIQTGIYPLCQDLLEPATSSQINTICNSSSYQSRANSKNALVEEHKPIISSPNNLKIKVYPNPFDTSTSLEYTLAESAQVDLKIFDLNGREVLKIVDNKFQNAGNYKLKVSGKELSPGVYLAVLRTPNGSKTVKLIKK